MKYKLVEYKNLTHEQKLKFFEFCLECSLEDQPAASNMWSDNWAENSHTLPYVLEIEKRFSDPTGTFFLLFDADRIIGCSGAYISSFDHNVGIAGVRTWIKSTHRHDSINREYFFPAEKAWLINRGARIVALTFNKYNKNIIEIFKRKRLGETNDRINTREPHHLFFNGVNIVPFSVNIKHTEQWVMYEDIDNYQFDWKSIQFLSGL